MSSEKEAPGKFPGATDIVVFKVPEPGQCWYKGCGKETNILAGPDHAPRDGNAHYTCVTHMDKGAVVQFVRAMPFQGTAIRVVRSCGLCKREMTNKTYCSVQCRLNALYPEREHRKAEVVRRRKLGHTFVEIGKALGITDARAAAIWRAAKLHESESAGRTPESV